ncbi:TPA: Ig-like domain-containing protein, partial [archaeon]|nr:Ig-like domain-containing protein [Candidatus Naiadarchaeales archaeon SRR2090153.bin461]
SANMSKVITYSNTSNKGILTINPDASLATDTNYTVLIGINASTAPTCAGCQVKDLAGNGMAAMYNITFKTAAVVAQPSGGGSSTGGGGTATGTVGSIDSSTSSLTTSVSVGGSVDIEIQVAAPSGGGSSSEDHTMSIVSITGTVVKLKFTSDPVFVDVNVGQTKYVDINGDSINDVRVTVNSVSGSTADVTVELLPSAKGTAAKAPYVPSTPSVSQPTAPTEPTAPSETAPAAKKPMNTKLLLIVVGVLVIVAAAYWFTQKELSPSKRSV